MLAGFIINFFPTWQVGTHATLNTLVTIPFVPLRAVAVWLPHPMRPS